MPEKPYNAVYCKTCGIECHAITGAYMEAEQCPKCYARDENKPKEDQSETDPI
jgi:hypothetical protein